MVCLLCHRRRLRAFLVGAAVGALVAYLVHQKKCASCEEKPAE
ncbi:MAG: YtxH domain-containing protein [Euryarchaeota archaeon]|nr:YtxH domain-containing protein [Euryarchaeota archaeon]